MQSVVFFAFFFFFQAEDGIRDVAVTGVQTCALPIWPQLDRRVRAHPVHPSAVGVEPGRTSVVRLRAPGSGRDLCAGLHALTHGGDDRVRDGDGARIAGVLRLPPVREAYSLVA